MEDSISPAELTNGLSGEEDEFGEIKYMLKEFVNCKIICSNIIVSQIKDEVDAVGDGVGIQRSLQSEEMKLDSVSPPTLDIFKNCMFKPAGENGKVDGTCLLLFQQKVYSHFAGGRTYSFINCQFVERGPTFFEQLGMKAREIFGESLQTRNGGFVELRNSKVKLKQIPVIVQSARRRSSKRSSSKRKSKS